MRSCEYSTNTRGPRKTKTVRLEDVVFRRSNRIVSHNDVGGIRNAETVSIIFRTQKNGDRDVIVTHHRSGSAMMCPVAILALLVIRLRSYRDSSGSPLAGSTTINAFAEEGTSGRLTFITPYQVAHHLRAAAFLYGPDRLGFPVSRLGTHSLRSGAAMAMYLANVPVETIKLIGRWRSDSFLKYLRPQVLQFTRDVAAGMNRNPNFFAATVEVT